MLPDRSKKSSYSHAHTYLPSSAIKVDDSPIRNLAYISGTRGNVRAATVTTVTSYYCHYVPLPLLLGSLFR